MLVLEVENIYRKADISKIGVVLNMLCNRAIIVKYYMIGHESSMVCPLDHFLYVEP